MSMVRRKGWRRHHKRSVRACNLEDMVVHIDRLIGELNDQIYMANESEIVYNLKYLRNGLNVAL